MTTGPDIRRIATCWLPPVAGIVLIVVFVSLARWQLDRAAEKNTLAALFDDDAAASDLSQTSDPALFQPVVTRGRYLADQQFLLDNIIKNNSLGYYVITPLRDVDGRLRLVNRGWIGKDRQSTELPAIPVDGELRDIEARIGRLPRVALRPAASIEAGQGWPKRALYPRREDIAAALGQTVDGPLLLLAAGEDDGYLRDWQPEERGSMMHYGYAFQWSALALTVAVILFWHGRKRLRRHREKA